MTPSVLQFFLKNYGVLQRSKLKVQDQDHTVDVAKHRDQAPIIFANNKWPNICDVKNGIKHRFIC